MPPTRVLRAFVIGCVLFSLFPTPAARAAERVALGWTNGILTLRGGALPVPIQILYLEAYCRPGSTDRDWGRTVIPHRTGQPEVSDDGHRLTFEDRLQDGVIANHEIVGRPDGAEFTVRLKNPTDRTSEAHWAQPCMRVGAFAGTTTQDRMALVPDYARKSFVFLDGKLTRMPTMPWADKARYVPGQVWAAPGVNRDDVNPRPLSSLVPSNGLIGCYSADDKQILAMAWDSWQELFQGIITCLHSDFRIGGLKAGETRTVRGRVWVLPADEQELVRRYRSDLGIR